MFWLFRAARQLRERGILGMNRRNAAYILDHNPRAGYPLVDDKLRMSRLVRTRREGTQIYYRLENEHIARLVTDALYNADHASAGIPEHHRADTGVTVLPQPNSTTGADAP